jgi:hypothetical protein
VIARGIDSTFREWTANGAGRWAKLPVRLGWTRADGSCWDEFIRLDANRDLPAFVADIIDVDAGTLASFTNAHHFAAMHGIVSDRIVDGQSADPTLLDARRSLLDQWLDALAGGLGDKGAARRVIGGALRDWKRGVDQERVILATGSADWEAYATAVALRLRWVSVTATAMLDHHGASAAARVLETTYDRLMLALQIMDDYVDADEDRATRGSSFECLRDLSMGPRALSGLLIAGAAQRATFGGLVTLGSWLRELSGHLLQHGEASVRT